MSEVTFISIVTADGLQKMNDEDTEYEVVEVTEAGYFVCRVTVDTGV